MSRVRVSLTILAKAIEQADKLERDGRRRALLDYLEALEASDPASFEEKQRAERRADRLRKNATDC